MIWRFNPKRFPLVFKCTKYVRICVKLENKIILIIIRIVIIIISLCAIIWINLPINFTAGTLIGTVIFGAPLICAVFPVFFLNIIKSLWTHTAGKITLCALSFLAAAGIVVVTVFSVNMLKYMNAPLNEIKCVMVLGCHVNGDKPSEMLEDRLKEALVLLKENPEAVCVVSGGQGRGENISEGECMRVWLEENGISPDRIYTEVKSTSTNENFSFSKAIFERLGITDKIAVVTNEFHQYRAKLYADKNGLSVGHYAVKTSPRLILNYWIRELAALLFVFF